jgi:hypothetical protein
LSFRLRVHTAAGEFGFRIDAVNISKLKPHEHTIEEAGNELLESVLKSGVQHDPIIADEKTLTVLDGMHRLFVAKEAGLKYVLSMLVDYYSSAIKVEGWNRLFKAKIDEVEETIKKFCTLADNGNCSLISGKEKVRFVLEGKNLSQQYCALAKLIETLSTNFGTPVLTPASQADHQHSLLVPPRLDKSDVIKAALNNQLFPPKSTRHVFPARILLASLPIRLLRNQRGLSDAEMSEAVRAYLRPKELVVTKGEIDYNDRHYNEEKLLLFI